MPDARSPGHQQVDHSTAGHDMNVADTIYQTYVSGSGDVSWPVQVGVPPLVADSYLPRPDLTAVLNEGLGRAGSAVLGQVVASGMGGVGKTQQAANVFDASSAELRVWVTATSRDAIIATYAQAAARIGATAADDPPERAAGRFVEHLATLDRSWLVVLDDVANEDDLTRLLPRGPKGAALITTRRRRLDIGATRWVDVDVYTPTEARSYLEQALTDAGAGVLDEVDELARDLGYLPLALSHAAGVIRYDAIGCGKFRRRFADRSRRLEELVPDRPPGDYGHTIATTWALAIDQADAMQPVGLAWPALQLAAVLDPNGAPDILWTTTPARRFAAANRTNSPETDTPVEAEALRRALRNLHHLHLLSHHPDSGPQAVRTHTLVQRAVTNTLTPSQLDATIHAAADALVEVWPNPENDPALAQALRANTAAVANQPATALWNPDAHDVLFHAGRSLGEAGLVTEAARYFDRLNQTATRGLGPDHPDTLATRNDLARCRGEAGDPKGAATAFDALLTDQLRVVGPDDPHTLTTRAHLAYWRGEAGDPQAAATAFDALLTDRLRVLGPDHHDTLSTRHNLAHWRGVAGDPQAAATAFDALLTDYLWILGPDHPDTLATRANLAYWRGEVRDPQSAATAFEALLTDRLRVLGPDHPHTLATRGSIAYWRGRAGDPNGAATDLEALLTDQLRVLGPDHPHTLATRGSIAYWRDRASSDRSARPAAAG